MRRQAGGLVEQDRSVSGGPLRGARGRAPGPEHAGGGFQRQERAVIPVWTNNVYRIPVKVLKAGKGVS